MKITFPDNSVKEFQKGISAFEIAESISPRLAKEVLSATVNGELTDIMMPIKDDATIQLHKFTDKEGKHAFWHSSAHLMAEAIEVLFPKTKLAIGPAIDNGFYYDIDLPENTTISDKDLSRIEQKMTELAREKNKFVREEISKTEALKFYKDKDDEYKVELIEGLEDGTISFYKQGNFTDLCRGPHLPNTSYIKAVKLTAIAGAYWRGDEKRKQLTRIYGISFPKKKLLDEYLLLLEEAKKRDHRKIGKELELFTFSSEVGAGLPLWLPNGTKLRENLINFLKKIQIKYGYEPVVSPHIANVDLFKISGHYQKYGEESFQAIKTPQEGEEFMLKPMNCPFHCEIYKRKPHSYKDLPIRMSEFGTVYRYEQSGEIHGLTRVRGFTQDDAHIFCTPEQLKEEFIKVIDIVLYIFKKLEFENFTVQISLRDKEDKEKYIGTDENWDKAEEAILESCKKAELETTIEYGEAAFYGPKLDFMVKDAIGRSWQLGTIQVDYNLPERFELEYTDRDDTKKRPVMIHRAPFGSLERFIAVLIEHTAGEFPLWLTPKQVVILPISEKFNDYAKKVNTELMINNINSEVDDRNEKMGKKIRDNEIKKIPYMLIVGENEMNENTVAVRKHKEGDIGKKKINEFIEFIKDLIDK